MPRSNQVCVPQLLSLCSRAQEPQQWNPLHSRAGAPQQEKPLQWEACAPQLGKSLLSNKDLAEPTKTKNLKEDDGEKPEFRFPLWFLLPFWASVSASVWTELSKPTLPHWDETTWDWGCGRAWLHQGDDKCHPNFNVLKSTFHETSKWVFFQAIQSVAWSCCCSVARACLTLCDPCSMPGFPGLHYLLKLVQTHVWRVGDTIQTSHLLVTPSSCLHSFPAAESFSSESALHIRWPKYWSFSFSISPSYEYSGLISFRID